MSDTTAPAALAAMLRELYVGRSTGRLVFEGNPSRTALLWKGRVVYASSSAEAEHLGELLVARGRISADDLGRASEKVTREKKRLGETLVAMGVLDRDGLEDAVADHVREILLRALSTPDVVVRFEGLDPERPLEEDVSPKIATGDLILEAVNRVPSEDLDDALGDLGRRLLLSNDPLLRFQRISLGPVDGYVLSRVDGSFSATELLQMIPTVPEEAKRSLLRLLSAGIVEFSDEDAPGEATPAPRASSEAGPATFEPARPAASPPPQPQPATASKAPPPSAAGAAAAGGAAAEAPRKLGIGAQRRALEEAFAALSGQNHFEILGLTRQAKDADVKKAYFRLARDFHPDRFADPRFADLRPKAEAIFLRVGQAYEILRDPARRGQYESDLATRAPRTPKAPPEATADTSEAEAPPSGHNPELLAQQAEAAIERAKVLFKKEAYWDVIQLVEPQLAHAKGIWLSQARLLLAQCYLQNPNWQRRGEEQLLALVEADPKHAKAHLLLGKFYVEKGLRGRAVSLLQHCVALDPENAEAARLLASVRPDDPERQSKPRQRGFIKKLLGG